MSKLRTLIVDDEPLAREGLATYVQQTDVLSLTATAADALSALPHLRDGSVDLLLLDINMPQLSGLELLKMLDRPPLVILTTAYPNYALEGFELNVLDYLVKPITFPRFLNSILKAERQFQLLQQSAPPRPADTNTKDHFFIKSDGKVERIQYDQLLYVEGMQNYVHLHTTRGRFTALLTLKTIDDELPQPPFYRVHRSFIVNLQRVQTLDGNRLLIGDVAVPISRANVATIHRILLGDDLLE